MLRVQTLRGREPGSGDQGAELGEQSQLLRGHPSHPGDKRDEKILIGIVR